MQTPAAIYAAGVFCDQVSGKQAPKPINQPIHHTGAQPIHNNRPGDGKHLRTDAQDETLRLEFHRRGGNGIGKACDGHQGSGAGMPGQVVIQAQSRQHRRQHHQRHGRQGSGLLFFKAQIGIQIQKQLPDGADQSADPEGIHAVPADRRLWAHLLHQLAILSFRHVHPSDAILPGNGIFLRPA